MAFRTFADNVAEQVPSKTVEPVAPVSAQRIDTVGIDRVLSTYRDTVLSVDHYEKVYGNVAVHDIAEEFGPDIATTLQVNQSLIPSLRQQLITQAYIPAEER